MSDNSNTIKYIFYIFLGIIGVAFIVSIAKFISDILNNPLLKGAEQLAGDGARFLTEIVSGCLQQTDCSKYSISDEKCSYYSDCVYDSSSKKCDISDPNRKAGDGGILSFQCIESIFFVYIFLSIFMALGRLFSSYKPSKVVEEISLRTGETKPADIAKEEMKSLPDEVAKSEESYKNATGKEMSFSEKTYASSKILAKKLYTRLAKKLNELTDKSQEIIDNYNNMKADTDAILAKQKEALGTEGENVENSTDNVPEPPEVDPVA